MTRITEIEDIEADALVVGAGPVGLTLAMDLAARGVRVAVCETRRYAEPPNVKCNHVSARSMEVFRRLGVAAKLRGAGLPADYPMVAPNYAQARSALAKQMGLGQQRRKTRGARPFGD